MKKSQLMFLLGGLVGLALLVVCWKRGSQDESDKYQWDTISRGDIREIITASGEIQARVKVNVGTSVMGEIKTLHVVDGQSVKAGDLLVTLDQERARQLFNQAQAAVESAKKSLAQAEASRVRAVEQFERMESLYHQGMISNEDFRQSQLAKDNAISATRVSEAGVAQQTANAAAAKDAMAKCILRAPISGQVTSLKAEKGETAIPGQSNLPGATLMVISDMSEIVAEIKVNESEVVNSRVGQMAQVTAESLPSRVFPGKVLEVATAAEKSGQDANMYKIKVALDMSTPGISDLRPGMTTRAVILTKEARQALRVPIQSLLEKEGNTEEAQKKGLLSPETHTVVLLVQQGKAFARRITMGIANTQYIEVKSGLEAGDVVLTGPMRKLKQLRDGTPVSLRRYSDTEAEKAPQASNGKGAKP